MAVLVDYSAYNFLKKDFVIKNANLSFYSHENPCLRFIVKGNISKKVTFKIIPLINALSYTPEIIIKNSNIFEIKINTSLLPKEWSGELLISDCGIVNSIPLNFSKKELN